MRCFSTTPQNDTVYDRFIMGFTSKMVYPCFSYYTSVAMFHCHRVFPRIRLMRFKHVGYYGEQLAFPHNPFLFTLSDLTSDN